MLEEAYVSAMHGLRAWGRRAGWIAPLERRRDRRVWLYLRSLMSIHDVQDMAQLDVPWWCFAAIDEIESFLAARGGAARAFEYGPGASTFWLARRCRSVAFVEHDRAWWDSFQPMIAPVGNVSGCMVPPLARRRGMPAPSASGRRAWRGLDFADYVAAIGAAGGPFDLIVIDGRARTACLAAAVAHLVADGLIVFDNSNRARYRQALRTCGLRARRFYGLTPASPIPTATTLLRTA